MESLINAARKWLGPLWPVLAILGQLAMVQPALARLLINQSLPFAVVGAVPGPPWQQQVFVSCGI